MWLPQSDSAGKCVEVKWIGDWGFGGFASIHGFFSWVHNVVRIPIRHPPLNIYFLSLSEVGTRLVVSFFAEVISKAFERLFHLYIPFDLYPKDQNFYSIHHRTQFSLAVVSEALPLFALVRSGFKTSSIFVHGVGLLLL